MPKPKDEIRGEFPVLDRMAYLNTGTAGPLPRRTTEVIRTQVDRQLQDGRSDIGVFMDEHFPMMADLRAAFARLLGAEEDEIALTSNTTDGMNIAIWGVNWQPGDEIVTTNLEHEGGIFPVYAVARRFGLTVRVVDLKREDVNPLDSVAGALTPRTRLLVLSHVSFCTGLAFPVAQISELAHRQGVMVVVDGAQSAGAIPVDVRQLGVDLYAVPGQKWLCGPEGVGALYVRRDRLSEIAQTYVGFFSMNDFTSWDYSGNFLPALDARRYEVSSVYWPALHGMRESLHWLEKVVGLENVYRAGREITAKCREMLAAMPGVQVLTPQAHAGLTSFLVDGWDPEQVSNELARRDVVIRWVRNPRNLRVSTGFFNNEQDLVRLREGLLAIQNGRG